DPLLAARYRLDAVITTVDAVNGQSTLDNHEEAVKQAAVADRLLLTKTDLATPQQIESLTARLKTLNPGAPLHKVSNGEIAPALLFNAGLYNPETKTSDVRAWLRAEAFEEPHDHDHGHDHHHHGHDHGHDHDHHDHGAGHGQDPHD